MPQSLKEVIQQIDWKFKRLDVAFDINSDYDNHVFLRPHGNTKTFSRETWSGYYLGGNYSKVKVAVYDRNAKEQSRGKDITHSHSTRFEFRFRPKLSEQTSIHDFNTDFIFDSLTKFNFVEDVTKLDTSKWNKNRLYGLRKNVSNKRKYKSKWKRLDKKDQDELKRLTEVYRIPFESHFELNKANLFKWTNNSHKASNEAV
ncbi:hypothetical protein [Pontibacillus salipaludis]|nr:hypothetical protein [Pontibacillus salipaludis]